MEPLSFTIDCRELVSRAAAHDCFARVFSLPAGYGRNLDALYDVLTGLAPLSPELARRIHVCYPQIDLEWLMTGRIRGIELPATGQSDV